MKLLERVHGAGNVLLKGISHENVIILGITVIGAGTGEVVDAIVGVIAARTTRRRRSLRRTGRRSLEGEEFRGPGGHRRHLPAGLQLRGGGRHRRRGG